MSVVEKEKKGRGRKRKRKKWFPDSSRANPSLFYSGAKLLALALGNVSWHRELVTDWLPLIESSAESDDARLEVGAWNA